VSAWSNITKDANGHTVAKDYFKAISFFAGLIYLVILVPAVILLCLKFRPEHEPVILPIEIGVTLLGSSAYFQAAKEFSAYFARKSADGNAQPLSKPGATPPDGPADMMPQPFNPNAVTPPES
jgi:hypothetical protein